MEKDKETVKRIKIVAEYILEILDDKPMNIGLPALAFAYTKVLERALDVGVSLDTILKIQEDVNRKIIKELKNYKKEVKNGAKRI